MGSDYDVYWGEIEKELDRVKQEIEERYKKEYTEYIRKELVSRGIQSVYLIDFILPSVDIRSQRITVDPEGKIEQRIRELDPSDIKAIASLRQQFYQSLRDNGAFKISSHTWVIIPGFEKKLVKDIDDIMKKLNRILSKYDLPDREIRFVEVYVPIEWAIEKMTDTIAEYRAKYDEVYRQLIDKEISRKQRQILAVKASKLKRIIKSLEEQLTELEKRRRRITEYLSIGKLGAYEERGRKEEIEEKEREKIGI